MSKLKCKNNSKVVLLAAVSLAVLVAVMLAVLGQRPAVAEVTESEAASVSEQPAAVPAPEETEDAAVGAEEERPVLDLTEEELMQLLQEQPLVITDKKLIIRSTEADKKYSERSSMRMTLQNNTDETIDYCAMFVYAWGPDNKPVRFRTMESATRTHGVLASNSDTSIPPGERVTIDFDMDILNYQLDLAYYVALPDYYDTPSGAEWYNPYYREFGLLYEGKDIENPPDIIELETADNTVAEELEEIINGPQKRSRELKDHLYNLPVRLGTTMTIRSGDTLLFSTLVVNNTKQAVTGLQIGFLAWDEENQPLIVQGQDQAVSNKEHLLILDVDDFNLPEGENSSIDIPLRDIPTKNHQAIIITYTTADGQVWPNPYFDEFVDLYVDKEYDKDQ